MSRPRRSRLAALAPAAVAGLALLAAGPVGASTLERLAELGIEVDCGGSECLASQISLEEGDGGFSLSVSGEGSRIFIGGSLSYSFARFDASLGDFHAPLGSGSTGSAGVSLRSGLPAIVEEALDSGTLVVRAPHTPVFVRDTSFAVRPGPAEAIPEPSAALVFAAGLGVVGLRLRRSPRS